MSRIRKFDKERLAELRRLHARGLNIAGCAEIMGENYSTTRRALRRGYEDDPADPGLRWRPGRPRRFDPGTVALIRRKRSEGRSIRQLARDFQCGLNTIRGALQGAEKP